jgi:hypothetical protein
LNTDLAVDIPNILGVLQQLSDPAAGVLFPLFPDLLQILDDLVGGLLLEIVEDLLIDRFIGGIHSIRSMFRFR